MHPPNRAVVIWSLQNEQILNFPKISEKWKLPITGRIESAHRRRLVHPPNRALVIWSLQNEQMLNFSKIVTKWKLPITRRIESAHRRRLVHPPNRAVVLWSLQKHAKRGLGFLGICIREPSIQGRIRQQAYGRGEGLYIPAISGSEEGSGRVFELQNGAKMEPILRLIPITRARFWDSSTRATGNVSRRVGQTLVSCAHVFRMTWVSTRQTPSN